MKRNYEMRARAIVDKASEADEGNVRELTLFCMNTRDVYFRFVEPTIHSLEKHAKAGDYTDDAAVVAWKNCADLCAKQYKKSYGDGEHRFSMADICSAACHLCDQNYENVWYDVENKCEKICA